MTKETGPYCRAVNIPTFLLCYFEEGNFPDPDNCRNYIVCSHQGSLTRKHCHDGQLFDTETCFCNDAIKTDCGARPNPWVRGFHQESQRSSEEIGSNERSLEGASKEDINEEEYVYEDSSEENGKHGKHGDLGFPSASLSSSGSHLLERLTPRSSMDYSIPMEMGNYKIKRDFDRKNKNKGKGKWKKKSIKERKKKKNRRRRRKCKRKCQKKKLRNEIMDTWEYVKRNEFDDDDESNKKYWDDEEDYLKDKIEYMSGYKLKKELKHWKKLAEEDEKRQKEIVELWRERMYDRQGEFSDENDLDSLEKWWVEKAEEMTEEEQIKQINKWKN